MRRFLPFLFFLALVSAAHAQSNVLMNYRDTATTTQQVSPVQPLPIGGGFIQTARLTDLVAAVTTANTAFGVTAPTARVCNTSTTIPAYVALGGSSVTVTTANGIPVQPSTCVNLSAVGFAYIAGITGSSTATLQISLGSGFASLGGGGAASAAPSGAAGGGLKGTYPNPTLADVNAIATSLAIGGATIGTDALGVTGTVTISSTLTAGIVNAQTGFRIAGAAASGAILRGNGTNFVAGVPARYGAAPSNPAGTTSTTEVMMGLAGAITPAISGNVAITITGRFFQSAATDGCAATIRYGTGTAPANAAAATGTATAANTATLMLASQSIPFTITTYVTGLTLSTAYWLDLSLAAVVGGTCSLFNLSMVALEQ